MMATLVEFRNVKKRHGSLAVLQGVSFTVDVGQVVCVIGPSGAGKSTLLRCINHLEKINSGRVIVDGELVGYRQRGEALHELKEREIARQRAKIGIVFQNFNLYPHMTARENITLAPRMVGHVPKPTADERADELLETIGLRHKADAYPRQLSGGEQQRVAIARALAIDPKLILFDEPTSALDPELVGEVLNVMHDLASGGMTMVVVTHEIAFAHDVADQILFMDHGVIVESGPPSQVLDHPREARTREFLKQVAED